VYAGFAQEKAIAPGNRGASTSRELLDFLDEHFGRFALGNECVGHLQRIGRQGEVGRQENNGNGRPTTAQLGSYLSAVQIRHVEVEHDQVNIVLLKERYPLPPVGSGKYVEAMAL
jgi:hypothetical protein